MRPDTHSLIGAYVLDALSANERSDFEDHLDHCAACRGEVDGLREAAAALAPAPLQPPAAVLMRVRAATAGMPQQGRQRRAYARVAAAAAAVVVIAGAAVAVRTLTDDGPTTAGDVFVAADAVSHTIASAAGQARVVTSREAGHAAIDLRDLRAAPAGATYQVWWIADGPPQSVAVGADVAVVPLANGILAVSLEPAGGSPQPTTDPLFAEPISR